MKLLCLFKHRWKTDYDGRNPSVILGGLPSGLLIERCSRCGNYRGGPCHPFHGYWPSRMTKQQADQVIQTAQTTDES